MLCIPIQVGDFAQPALRSGARANGSGVLTDSMTLVVICCNYIHVRRSCFSRIASTKQVPAIHQQSEEGKPSSELRPTRTVQSLCGDSPIFYFVSFVLCFLDF